MEYQQIDQKDENQNCLSQDQELLRKQKIELLKSKNKIFLNKILWLCIQRPQYPKNCGLNSVTSCFNYLFSKVGQGNLDLVSQEESLALMGYGNENFQKMGFNPGIANLIKWFSSLCSFKKVQGKGFILWKKKPGSGPVVDYENDQVALEKIKEKLQSPKSCLIYHCMNHYLVPVGFQERITGNENSKQTVQHLIIADQSRNHFQPLISVNFQTVVQDLSMELPEQISIRFPQKGIVLSQKPNAQEGQNNWKQNFHCIICFEKN